MYEKDLNFIFIAIVYALALYFFVQLKTEHHQNLQENQIELKNDERIENE